MSGSAARSVARGRESRDEFRPSGPFVNLPVVEVDRSVAFFGSLGFMYSRSFFDPDGHGWQVMWMDPAAA